MLTAEIAEPAEKIRTLSLEFSGALCIPGG
jgi:hypothetical protein